MDKPDEQKEIVVPNDLSINPEGTAIFTINEDGPIQGSYKGVFTLRCYLSPLDSLAASRQFRELIGPYGESAGEQDRYLAFCMSQLNKRVIKGPPWWDANNMPGNIPDLNIIALILDRALIAESAYKQRLEKMKAEALERSQRAAQAIQDSLKPNKKED